MSIFKRILSFFKPKCKPVELTPEEAQKLAAYERSYPIIMAPWHGIQMAIRVRRLGDSQKLASGDFGLIKDFTNHLVGQQQPTIEEMNAYATRQDEICQLTMVNPTYDEMMAIAGAHVDRSAIERQLDEIKALFSKMPRGPEKKALKDEYEATELKSKFLLPPDFMAFVVHYALAVDQNDIDDMTDEVLRDCAVLASRGNDNPHDHFPGRITARVVKEFDIKAWNILDAEQRDKAKKKRGA